MFNKIKRKLLEYGDKNHDEEEWGLFKRSCLRRHGAEVDANNHLLHGQGAERNVHTRLKRGNYNQSRSCKIGGDENVHPNRFALSN